MNVRYILEVKESDNGLGIKIRKNGKSRMISATR